MSEPWLERWEQGRIGWHEPAGNSMLRSHWPELAEASRVLVPFCGKTSDLLWLANRKLEVVGIEVSQIAVEAFFNEHELEFESESHGKLIRYQANKHSISIHCGDYFDFESQPFDALFDRGSLVALPAENRPPYVEYTKALLKDDAYRFIITLEYDQAAANGPPFSVTPDEIGLYWSDMKAVERNNDIDDSPPKFKEAGLDEVIETAWASPLKY